MASGLALAILSNDVTNPGVLEKRAHHFSHILGWWSVYLLLSRILIALSSLIAPIMLITGKPVLRKFGYEFITPLPEAYPSIISTVIMNNVCQ
jgi:hypothetical protein